MRNWIVLAGALAMTPACSGETSCVARGTLVWTPQGWRRIEELQVGDAIYSVDEDSGAQVETSVTALRTAEREVGLIAFADTELMMTTDHPVFCPTERRYESAGDWFLGKRAAIACLADDGLRTIDVERAESFVMVSEVFDITVEHELHNFVANGVLVHNKSIALECELDGETYQDGGSCFCADGAQGFVDCSSEPRCLCGSDDSDAGDDAATPGELYTECELDPNSDDPAIANCGRADGPARSCVLEYDECATGHCGRYEGSDPFCTRECDDDADCPDGSCIEFVFQTDVTYCLPDE